MASPTSNVPKQCAICDTPRTYSTEDQLRHHLRTVHQSDLVQTTLYTCTTPSCSEAAAGKTWSNFGQYVAHMKQQHGVTDTLSLWDQRTTVQRSDAIGDTASNFVQREQKRRVEEQNRQWASAGAPDLDTDMDSEKPLSDEWSIVSGSGAGAPDTEPLSTPAPASAPTPAGEESSISGWKRMILPLRSKKNAGRR